MDLPEITEVKRLCLEPGDALVVRTGTDLSPEQADRVKERVRVILGLSLATPVLVLPRGVDVEVVSGGRGQPG